MIRKSKYSRSRPIFWKVLTVRNSLSKNSIEEAAQHDVNNDRVINGIVSANDNELMKKLNCLSVS